MSAAAPRTAAPRRSTLARMTLPHVRRSRPTLAELTLRPVAEQAEAESIWGSWSSTAGPPPRSPDILQLSRHRGDWDWVDADQDLDRILNARLGLRSTWGGETGWRPAASASSPQLHAASLSASSWRSRSKGAKVKDDFVKERVREGLDELVASLTTRRLHGRERSSSPRGRDTTPVYDLMLPRGPAAMQGLRVLQDDRGVRAMAGLQGGPVETAAQRDCSVERLESRSNNAIRARPDVGPTFGHYTLFEQTGPLDVRPKGHPLVRGSSAGREAARSPLQRPRDLAPFQRKAAAPGFTAHVAKVRARARAHVAMPGWASASDPAAV
ncbi:unnamed protein product [Prorocentrum cordatum]|uniref:Uncharacterized protein n=1 Tax=Prorocentrum cordatum TaxID=2364126 RepID=A0ABN9W9B7_9DINO|nr:unnamed protein product [Polarella glacialis]